MGLHLNLDSCRNKYIAINMREQVLKAEAQYSEGLEFVLSVLLKQ